MLAKIPLSLLFIVFCLGCPRVDVTDAGVTCETDSDCELVLSDPCLIACEVVPTSDRELISEFLEKRKQCISPSICEIGQDAVCRNNQCVRQPYEGTICEDATFESCTCDETVGAIDCGQGACVTPEQMQTKGLHCGGCNRLVFDLGGNNCVNGEVLCNENSACGETETCTVEGCVPQ